MKADNIYYQFHQFTKNSDKSYFSFLKNLASNIIIVLNFLGWYQDERGEWHQDPAYAQYYEEYYKQFYEYQEQQRVQNNGENDAQPRKNSTNSPSLSKVRF